jgi:hypothetical protein
MIICELILYRMKDINISAVFWNIKLLTLYISISRVFEFNICIQKGLATFSVRLLTQKYFTVLQRKVNY